MDHQTGAAGQRPQKLTAKIERIGRWVEEKVSEVEEYRNTAGNRSQPATVCRPRPRPLRVSKRICPPIIGPVTTARWPLTQACQSQKSSLRPLFRTSFLPPGCGEFRARINGRAPGLIIQPARTTPLCCTMCMVLMWVSHLKHAECSKKVIAH